MDRQKTCTGHVHTADPSLVGLKTIKNNCVAEMCSGSEAGSYVRLIDFCITQL